MGEEVMVTIFRYNILEEIDNTGITSEYNFKGTREQRF